MVERLKEYKSYAALKGNQMCAGMYEELRAFPKPELHHSPFTLIRGTKILPEHVNHESGFVLHNSHLQASIVWRSTVSRNVYIVYQAMV